MLHVYVMEILALAHVPLACKPGFSIPNTIKTRSMKGIIYYAHALCRRLYDDNLALYGKRYYYYVWELPVFVLMGVAAGLLGSAFIKLNIRATQLRARFVSPRKPWLRLLEVPCIYPPCE